MKRKKILLWTGAVCLIAFAVWAASPSFSDFLTSQFGTTSNNKVAIKSGPFLTNVFIDTGIQSFTGEFLRLSGRGDVGLSEAILMNGTLNENAAVQAGTRIDHKTTQTGTAGYDILQVNADVTTEGSGTKNLLNLLYSSTPKFTVDINGSITLANQASFANAFRTTPETTPYSDNEYITEAHATHLINSAFGFEQFLSTNDNASATGNKSIVIDPIAASQWQTNSLSAGSNFITYFFTTNTLNSTTLFRGEYLMHIHNLYTGAGNPVVAVGCDLYLWHAGAPVFVVAGETLTLANAGTEASVLLHMELGANTTVSVGDLLGVRFYAVRTGGASATLVTHLGGTTDASLNGPSSGFTAGPEVTTITAPMGAWFSANVGDGLKLVPATSFFVTNTADGWAFTNAFTNVIRMRLALPYDWDGGTVQMGIRATCTGTNSPFATNVVFGVRAAAIGNGERCDSPTFGTLITVTNHISTNAFIQGNCITRPITIGNTPSSDKSVLWELQRIGDDPGDVMTNEVMAVTETRIYYRRIPANVFPTASP